jgi:type I phosphodiesterase/nucleotide pyrophosphatase
MVIQVDGLEPKDVTPQTTPFLWSLAHPGQTGATAYPATAVYANMPGLSGRAGFAWQAARGVMEAATAPNVASLLSGGYPEQTGIPADWYEGRFRAGGVWQTDRPRRLGAQAPPETDATADAPVTSNELLGGFKTLFQMVNDDNEDKRTASFVGDPALAPLAIDEAYVDPSLQWRPNPYVADAEHPNDPPSPSTDQAPPLLCPIPRAPVGAQTSDAAVVGCVAPDIQTLQGQNGAFAKLKAAADGGAFPVFTYIELGELGAAKRYGAELEGGPASIPDALHETDAALATFFGRMINSQSEPAFTDVFSRTVVMVLGDHGYEQTLPQNRVADPAAPGEDLAHYVAAGAGGAAPDGAFRLIPQGTVATVYCKTDCPADAGHPDDAYRARLAALKAKLDPGGEVDDACTGCIAETLYLRPQLAPAGQENQALSARHHCRFEPPVEDKDFAEEGGIRKPVRPQCSSWHLDHNGFQGENQVVDPSGVSGELVVALKPGWATGAAASATDLTNPYPASDGGPRDRPIAAIVNGPSGVVRQIGTSSGGRYPVMASDPKDDQLEPGCPASVLDANVRFPASATSDGVDAANADAASLDDADASGYLCQAEIVDFAPTIASLLKINTPPQQLAGRLLREAFAQPLPAACQECQPVIPTTFLKAGPIAKEGAPPLDVAAHYVTFRFSSDPRPPAVKYWCSFDGSAFERCGRKETEFKGTRSKTLGPLAVGLHSFEVKAESAAGFDPTPQHVDFRVIPFFDFEGLLRRIGAFVTDKKGHPAKRSSLLVDRKGKEERVRAVAKRGARLDHLDVRAELGRPFTRISITLYRELQYPAGFCNPNECGLNALVRFPTFTMGRGPVDMIFAVPKRLTGISTPDHVGVFIQELRLNDQSKTAACRQNPSLTVGPKKHKRKYCTFTPVGPVRGQIIKIQQAKMLHKRK